MNYKLLSEFIVEDMKIMYLLDNDSQKVGITIEPLNAPSKVQELKIDIQSLIQCKIVGDNYSGSYMNGSSMLYSGSNERFLYKNQEVHKISDETIVKTVFETEDGITAVHINSWKTGRKYVKACSFIENNSNSDIKLEMVSAFTLSGISPYSPKGNANLLLHRLRSKWSMEARFVTESFEDLQLEDSWTMSHTKSIRFGQVGSMPTKDYFPFMAVEDADNGIIWGVQMGSASSWQMEIARADDGAVLCGGYADREFGHWMKTLEKGERFTTGEAVLSVCIGGIDDISQRLTPAQADKLNIPESEENLPVIFNEYCTTWGCPSSENIRSILNAIKNKGIDYFVIDCGWFKKDGVRWDISMGDYIPSDTLFPEGIADTVQAIKSCGMLPGIWFEIEAVGKASKAYYMTDHLLKRDGITLTTQTRRFWDMNDSWVKDYLDEKVIGFLKQYGFKYIKIDYNDTIGLGCDNKDSLGEGLRLNMEASAEFFKRIRTEIPDIVIENCSSGGNRLEPVFMSLSSMASFSDAHECVEIPIIAANLHRAILPRQSQIWCVIRTSDTLKRIAYSVSATFLGRMCISGDVTELSGEQWRTLENGISFYKAAAPIIKHGFSRIYGERNKSDRHPEGWQGVVRMGDNGNALVTVHTFANAPDTIEIDIPKDLINIQETYSHEEFDAHINENKLIINNPESFSGYALILQ